MAETKIVETGIVDDLADWQPGDCDPELTKAFREAFPDHDELEDILYRRAEKGLPLKAKTLGV